MSSSFHNTFHSDLMIHRHLELLVGEAAAGAAGALDPDAGRSLCVADLQQRGEHAPPGNTTHSNFAHFLT